MTVAERLLAAEDVALEQSFAMCPPLLQKRHRFWSKWRWHSCWVSLLSFLSFKERSEFSFFWLELPELAFPVVFEVLELPELFLLLLLLFLFLLEFGVVLLLVLVPLPLSLERSEFLWPLQSGVPNNVNQWIGKGCGVWRGCWVCRHE